MKIETMIKKITSARTALSVISPPQVELVKEKLISSGSTPARSAKPLVRSEVSCAVDAQNGHLLSLELILKEGPEGSLQ